MVDNKGRKPIDFVSEGREPVLIEELRSLLVSHHSVSVSSSLNDALEITKILYMLYDKNTANEDVEITSYSDTLLCFVCCISSSDSFIRHAL